MKTEFIRFALCAMAICLLGVFRTTAEVVVIANPSVAESSATIDDLEKVFLGKKRSINASSVQPVTLKSGATHEEFLAAVVKRSAGQFSAFWKQKIVAGTGIPPKSFDDETALIAYVRENADAIGYVSAGVDTTGTKVITVN